MCFEKGSTPLVSKLSDFFFVFWKRHKPKKNRWIHRWYTDGRFIRLKTELQSK